MKKFVILIILLSGNATWASTNIVSVMANVSNGFVYVPALEARLSSPTLVYPSFFGAIGNGVADDTVPLQTALNYAYSNKLFIASTTATYRVTTTVWIRCQGDLSLATVKSDASFSPTILVGVTNYATAFRVRGGLSLPTVENTNKPSGGGWGTDKVPFPGAVGVEMANLYESIVKVPKIGGFAVGLDVSSYGGANGGNVYNWYDIGLLSGNEINLRLQPRVADPVSGWVNQNTFAGGRYSVFSSDAGLTTAGRHIQLRAERTDPIQNLPNNNLFLNPSVEGDAMPYAVELCGRANLFLNGRYELNYRVLLDDHDGRTSYAANHFIGGYNLDSVKYYSAVVTTSVVTNVVSDGLGGYVTNLVNEFTYGTPVPANPELTIIGNSIFMRPTRSAINIGLMDSVRLGKEVPHIQGFMDTGIPVGATETNANWSYRIYEDKMEGKQDTNTSANLRLYWGADTSYVSAARFYSTGSGFFGDGSGLTNLPTGTGDLRADGSVPMSGDFNGGGVASVTNFIDLVASRRLVVGKGLNAEDISAYAPGASQRGTNSGTQVIGTGASGSSQIGRNDAERAIWTNSYGASQSGYNSGTQTIQTTSHGAFQSGYNSGVQTIETNASGASQLGANHGVQTIGAYSQGASQGGKNEGTLIVGTNKYGASQRGYVSTNAAATNNGVGAMQLLDLTNGQNAATTSGGSASLLLGAGTASNRNAIVAGDGQVSHGDGSVSAVSFWVGETDLVALAGSGASAWSGHPATNPVDGGGQAFTNLSDLSGSGRRVFGTGLNVTNIAVSAVGSSQSGRNDAERTIWTNSYGASQSGYNSGTQAIQTTSHGAFQAGYNAGIQTMETNASGASQLGANHGVQTIGRSSQGANQSGHNEGYQIIGSNSYGASQRGYVSSNSTATNYGIGAVQLLDLTNGQNAATTSGGSASLLIGAGTASNRNAIVAGDGQVSHGDGSITAGGGFFGDGSLLTGVAKPTYGIFSNAVATNDASFRFYIYPESNACWAIDTSLTGPIGTNAHTGFWVSTNGLGVNKFRMVFISWYRGTNGLYSWDGINTNGLATATVTAGVTNPFVFIYGTNAW